MASIAARSCEPRIGLRRSLVRSVMGRSVAMSPWDHSHGPGKRSMIEKSCGPWPGLVHGAARAHPRCSSGSPPRGIPARPSFETRALPGFPLAHQTGGARYQLSLGVPDTRLLPTALLSRAFRRALRSRAGRAGLDYGDPRGELRLRTALAAML